MGCHPEVAAATEGPLMRSVDHPMRAGVPTSPIVTEQRGGSRVSSAWRAAERRHGAVADSATRQVCGPWSRCLLSAECALNKAPARPRLNWHAIPDSIFRKPRHY